MEDLDNKIKGKPLSDKNIFEESLIQWKFLTKVNKKKSNLKTRIKRSKLNLFLKQINGMSCLETLQE